MKSVRSPAFAAALAREHNAAPGASALRPADKAAATTWLNRNYPVSAGKTYIEGKRKARALRQSRAAKHGTNGPAAVPRGPTRGR